MRPTTAVRARGALGLLVALTAPAAARATVPEPEATPAAPAAADAPPPAPSATPALADLPPPPTSAATSASPAAADLPPPATSTAPSAAPAPADAPPTAEAVAHGTPELTEEERRALEESLGADRAEAAEAAGAGASAAAGGGSRSMNPDIALILDFTLAAFSGEPLPSGGHDPTENGFNLQQLEMHLGANVDPFFRFDANLVFGQFGVEIEEAFATTLALPASLQARAGLFLTRFGRINATHLHTWAFVDQPLVVGKFLGPEGSRGLGAELSWLAPLPWYVEVVASANQADGECCARSFFGAEDLGVDDPGDLLYTTALKQFFPFGPAWSLSWGLSGQFGPNPTGPGNRTAIYGTDLYLRWRPVDVADPPAVSLQAEALYRTRQVPDDRLGDWGLYAQLVWDLDARFSVGARYERVSGVDDDPLDPQWTEARQRVSAQATWRPSHFSRLRLQANHDRPEWRDDPVWAGFLQLEVLAGAHGAHTY